MRIGSWSLRGLAAVLAAAALPACSAIRTANQSDTGAAGTTYGTASESQVRSCQAEAYRRLPGSRADDIDVDPRVREARSDAVLLDWSSRQSDARGTCLVNRAGDIERFEIAGGGYNDDGYGNGGYAASSRQIDACRDEAERRLSGVRSGDIDVNSRVRDERDGVATLDWSVRQTNNYGTCAVDRDGRVRNFAFASSNNNNDRGYGYNTGSEPSRARDECRRHAEFRDMEIVRVGDAELQNDRTYKVIVTAKAFGTESPFVCTYDPSRGTASMPGDK
jgi:hypothetical protein